MALTEFLDGLGDQGQGHVMDLEPRANVVEEGDGELTAQVFPELFKPGHHQQLAVGVVMEEFGGEQFEAEPFKEAKDPFRRFRCEETTGA